MEQGDERLAPAGEGPADELVPEAAPKISHRGYVADITEDGGPVLEMEFSRLLLRKSWLGRREVRWEESLFVGT